MSGIDWSPVVSALLALLAAVIVSLRPALVRYINAVVESKLAGVAYEQKDLLFNLGQEAVAAAAQLGGTNEQKKVMAIGYVVRRAATLGLTVDPDDVSVLIEAVLGREKKAVTS